MTLTQLNILKTLIETGSFTKTAETLFITQSAVSHSIASLEDELEIQLIKNNKKGIALTEAGEKIYALAKDVMSRVYRSREEISALKNMQAGKLSVGCFQSVSAKILPGVLKRFKQKYPGIEISWFEGTDLEVADWLSKGAVDIGFVVLPAEGLEIIPLLEDKFLAVFPEKHKFCGRKNIGVKQLSGEQFITFKGSSCGMLVSFNLARDLPETKMIEARNINTVAEMVKNGMGVAIIPELAIPSNIRGICSVPLFPIIKREIALAFRSGENISLSAKAFIELTKKHTAGSNADITAIAQG